jgi:hypothetical protein
MGFEQYTSLSIALLSKWEIVLAKLAEVVDSSPTQSVSSILGNSVWV